MKHLSRLILVNLFLLAMVFNLSAQCISGDCKNGKGIYLYPSGAKYIGTFLNGEIHGIGTCYYTDGSKYQGNWVYRYPEGNGTKFFVDGSQWTGSWEKGQPVDDSGQLLEDILQAKGTRVDDGTNIQSGCLSGNCKNGEGTWAYSDGSKYEGQFKNGQIDGRGIFYYADGDKYEGDFKNNFAHGQGSIVRANGEIMIGEWLEGEYIGKGEKTVAEEGCIEGNCLNGIGTYIYKNASAKYKGSFANGQPEGSGICDYANGERYEGEWLKGSFEGKGSLSLTDGTIVSGNWKNGTYLGKDVAATTTITPSVKQDNPKDEVVQKEAKTMQIWAVVIGVSSYSHMPPLRYTDDDAYRIYAFLKSPEGGALKDDHIRILIDEDATKVRITEAMKEVYSQAGPNDLIMLYFSGHGLKGSFLPIDFDGFNNKLLHEEINEILKQSPAKYKLCIADACHSGSLLSMKGAVENTLTKFYETLAQANPGTALVLSSKSEETSLESSGLRQGVFSHFLIRGLKGEADTDGNDIVSIQELFVYINRNVKEYTMNRQSPVIKGEYDERMTVSVVRE